MSKKKCKNLKKITGKWNYNYEHLEPASVNKIY